MIIQIHIKVYLVNIIIFQHITILFSKLNMFVTLQSQVHIAAYLFVFLNSVYLYGSIKFYDNLYLTIMFIKKFLPIYLVQRLNS